MEKQGQGFLALLPQYLNLCFTIADSDLQSTP
jgi:hypothetical protein